ncbi:ribonuclease HIII [Pseudothermotoga thermarum]|uniref:Ribonuclease n=1 Tax=Pseudothermotoga thermarum DSM 5069 TaxID=688269 RepID=F7YVH8_9THEM|nr:ribonuclease HIII [Pseudothermotoga thermarum]AEH51633.1 ribonuclease HII/HIII [Pseudothermotoga thermarum DSM 5069]
MKNLSGFNSNCFEGFHVEEEKTIQNGIQYKIKDIGCLRIYFKKDGTVSIDTSQIKPEYRANFLKALGVNLRKIDGTSWQELKQTVLKYQGEVRSLDSVEIAKTTGLTLIYDGNTLTVLRLSSKTPKEILQKIENSTSAPADTLSLLESLAALEENRALEIAQKLCSCEEKTVDKALQRWVLAQNIVDPKYILPAIGSDEAGKGDLFGPIVVAAVYVGFKQYDKLSKLGIKDSKSISDKKILEFSKIISEVCPCSVCTIEPSSLKKGQTNLQLERKHFECISKLLEETDSLIIVFDDFGAKNLTNAFFGRKVFGFKNGERNLAVASASVVARAEFLKHLQSLSEKYGLEIPAGSSEKAVQAAKRFINKFGLEEFKKISKTTFSNVERLINS